MSALTKSPAWKTLQSHHRHIAGVHMRDLFKDHPDRFKTFSLEACGLYLDYSKNRITSETMELLTGLARQADVETWRNRMYAGEKINTSEDRAALHIALRNLSDRPVRFEGRDVMGAIKNVLAKMRTFSDAVRNGQWTGASGKKITDVVNIGIGGSDLGPLTAIDALRPYGHGGPKIHFISNVDGACISDVLDVIDPDTTLFIISSKTFTTQETMVNALTARTWLIEKSSDPSSAVDKQFMAISADARKASEFGIHADNLFEFWDWVGGRNSLWSAIGLPIALSIGMDRFTELLAGAHGMDEHFRTAPLDRNMPVILALLGIWYRNFFGVETQAILPYDVHLGRFPAHLEQLDMESNGKQVDRDGSLIDYATAPVIWGDSGTNGQHAFFQLLHQGVGIYPCDFIAAARSHTPIGDHHAILLANFIAQTESLMMGRTKTESRAELENMGVSATDIERLLPYRIFPGNQPTNAIVFEILDPATLGALIALYEHKVFTQSVIWNINPFDQWGVELGKRLAGQILPALLGQQADDAPPSPSDGLIDYFFRNT